ncbi:hypothetical protein EGR_10563 [Echinococcus granulosus]|uniref:Uncharacterized protein n=1 Tax=Echinococcus granulosus TaxID=6210 RepID=W6U864_ECHGR|nr:hypothetical protein EGR_10563 [Echinococcus granulosus]EUB54577.1 hypothetical protein EGR_10563 [Echinococcus granulosus]
MAECRQSILSGLMCQRSFPQSPHLSTHFDTHSLLPEAFFTSLATLSLIRLLAFHPYYFTISSSLLTYLIQLNLIFIFLFIHLLIPHFFHAFTTYLFTYPFVHEFVPNLVTDYFIQTHIHDSSSEALIFSPHSCIYSSAILTFVHPITQSKPNHSLAN